MMPASLGLARCFFVHLRVNPLRGAIREELVNVADARARDDVLDRDAAPAIELDLQVAQHLDLQMVGTSAAGGEFAMGSLAGEAAVIPLRIGDEEALPEARARADASDRRARLGRGVVEAPDLAVPQSQRPVSLRDEV